MVCILAGVGCGQDPLLTSYFRRSGADGLNKEHV
jgi:hypothetical protein